MVRPGCEARFLGLDVGAVSLSMVELDPLGSVLQTFYAPHRGAMEATLRKALKELGVRRIEGVSASSSTPDFFLPQERFNDQLCLMAAQGRLHPEARSILLVGGERFGLIRFDARGQYLSYRGNPACAAGTGGFLDQQARRLELDGPGELSALAMENRDSPPKIASRCAVFAKTDLVHAQQEGYGLPAICDGLCRGVVKNIVDTLFTGDTVHGPLLVVGGVARNPAVIAHLRELLDLDILVDPLIPFGATGAALLLLEKVEAGSARRGRELEEVGWVEKGRAEKCRAEKGRESPGHPAARAHGGAGNAPGRWEFSHLVRSAPSEREYEFPPLELEGEDDPVSSGCRSSFFRGEKVDHSHPVEVNLYREVSPGEERVFLGIDIGSTSTKAVATDEEGRVLAGFYTATAGKPLVATQVILEGLVDWADRGRLDLRIQGVGTTGAGRKFIGKILGADLILDEITAHARAAVELHPRVDTIIEIGGQDSKFTTLRDGRVTLSVMNSVCAAGTGSFIEEQARRLNVPLSDYVRRTRGCASPMASERCTVFMERDLNHYLREGYGTGEVLAAVLHSVRENYLNKVAVEAAVGDIVVFQGATARNSALVAAFRQRLGKPILVSPYCHLTGALGAALTLRDEGVVDSLFRGLGLHQMPIQVRSQRCDLCSNHCKLSVAEVEGETVAYGFLCGRDWDTRRFVRGNRSGFDLFKARSRAMAAQLVEEPRGNRFGSAIFDSESLGAFRKALGNVMPGPLPEKGRDLTVGLPAALHLFEDLFFWKTFFRRLGIRTLTSESYADAMKEGRKRVGAEMCAPMTALHGHVHHLLERTDLVFLPFYLEKKSRDDGISRKLCYYTQFAPSLGMGIRNRGDRERVLTPLVNGPYPGIFSKTELYRTLNRHIPGGVSPLEISAAFDEAEGKREGAVEALRKTYRREALAHPDLHVVLLGRPYTVLSRWMNKGIPQTFESLGVRVFYQDMLTHDPENVEGISSLLEDVHWHYAAKILAAAHITARTPGAYPVLVTSFKCSPDSFVVPYLRQILEAENKPYLILELDEHDSRLGYETRIEAAVRAFRNHHRSAGWAGAEKRIPAPDVVDSKKVELSDKTIFFPNWDSLSLRLVVAAVRRTGLDARLLEASEESVRRSLRHNSGQCTPLNIIAQDFMENVERQGLDPGRSVLWMAASNVACNIHLYPHHIRTILKGAGKGFQNSQVYVGGITLQDMSSTLPLDVYLGYMFGGFLRRMGCRIRPYEMNQGDTDRVLSEEMLRMERAFQAGDSKEAALKEVIARLEGIPAKEPRTRPQVAVFGDLYARDNRILNQDLVHFVETHGGEVITTPYTSYVKMVVRPYYWKWFLEGEYLNVITTRAWMAALSQLEKRYFRYFEQILGEPEPQYDVSPQEILGGYNVRMEHTGESMDNLLKIFYIARHHPRVTLFVQTSPAFCCPSLITEAMSRDIEKETGIPVISVTYDGTGGGKNEVILPYLAHPRTQATA